MKHDLAALSGSVVVGILAGWFAWLSDEVVPPVVVVLVGVTALAFYRPRVSPITALVIGLSVPFFYIVSSAMGFPSRYPPEPGPWASSIVLVPTAIGALIGASARFAMSGMTKRVQRP